MREKERVRIMERMREKLRERKRERRMKERIREKVRSQRERERRMMERMRERDEMRERREKEMIEKMAFVALNSLHLTLFHLLHSIRISIDPRSREFLIFASLGVNEAVEILKSLEKFRGRIESKSMEALEGEFREATWKLENVLDSHVLDQFLTQFETESIQHARDERQPLVFSLNLQGMEQDIDGFIGKVMKMEKLLNPWLREEYSDGDEKEPDVFRLSNQSEVDALFISWLPEEEEEEEEEEGDGDGGGDDGNELEEEDGDGCSGDGKESEEEDGDGSEVDALFISWLPKEEDSDEEGEGEGEEEEEDGDGGGDDGNELEGEDANGGGDDGKESEEEDGDGSEVDVSRSWFISWFATKAASIFLGIREEYIQDLENLLPQEEEDDDDYAVLFSTDRSTDFSRMVLEDRYRKINSDLMIWWINKATSAFVMEMDSTQRLVNPFPEDVVVVGSSGTESGVSMVGSTDLFCSIRDNLLSYTTKGFKRFIISGMAGIGKTALAKKIIEDPLISSKFECCIFVRLGPEYEWEETLQAILAQMPEGDKILMEEDLDLDYSVRKTLENRKCLLVLDDIWNRGPRRNISDIFPSGNSQSAILFTSRVEGAASGGVFKVSFLNKEESWDLLRKKIFGEKRCPRELEIAGKTIAENCEGLPLLIISVAGFLSQAEQTPEYWSKVAANKTNSIFVDAYDQVSGVVYPSYYYLPQHLKACFLYLGAFPQNDELRVSKLISLWSADGFLGVPYSALREHAYNLLNKLLSNNVALETQRGTFRIKLKALTLHSVFWYVCKREARNEKFLHVLNSYIDASLEGIKSQRRLSIYKNTILSRKDVRDSIASISAVQSLLCTGPYHQYEVPICLGELRLLKVLDALSIRFYEFPAEVVKLAQLRYLALTCNGTLPPSISNLWCLRFLILHQHLSIKSSSVSHSYLPVEIWDLLELEHLQITGRNLPNPPPGAVLRNLLILLDVGAHTCNERVLASTPNLEKLRVQIELMPIIAEPLGFCDDISHLKALRSLQFVVVNPELKFKIPSPPAFDFYSSIRKLTLSGFGYPWEDMQKIAKLVFLKVLKLKCYAFLGEKWQVKEGEFEKLEYISIEDTDLVQWTGYFENLRCLTIKNCYRLQELPKLSFARKIQVVDCNPSAVTCAKQMARMSGSKFYVDSSWLGDGKLA